MNNFSDKFLLDCKKQNLIIAKYYYLSSSVVRDRLLHCIEQQSFFRGSSKKYGFATISTLRKLFGNRSLIRLGLSHRAGICRCRNELRNYIIQIIDALSIDVDYEKICVVLAFDHINVWRRGDKWIRKCQHMVHGDCRWLWSHLSVIHSSVTDSS